MVGLGVGEWLGNSVGVKDKVGLGVGESLGNGVGAKDKDGALVSNVPDDVPPPQMQQSSAAVNSLSSSSPPQKLSVSCEGTELQLMKKPSVG